MPGGMKLAYHADTDSLYVEFTERPSVESTEIAAGVVVDFDGHGRRNRPHHRDWHAARGPRRRPRKTGGVVGIVGAHADLRAT
jgi:hypothetical protein